MAAGGDRDKLHLVTAIKRDDDKGVRTFHLQEDLRELEKLVADVGDVEVVIFDPISSYFGRTDTYKNTEVRIVLEPVAEFADRCGITILGNTKATATMRILDSVAMSALSHARCVVVEDTEDVVPSVPPGEVEPYEAPGRLGVHDIREKVVPPGVSGTCIAWDNVVVATTVDEALEAIDAKRRPETAIEEAMSYLREVLTSGPKRVPEVQKEATECGIALGTLTRAKQRLGLKKNGTWRGTETRNVHSQIQGRTDGRPLPFAALFERVGVGVQDSAAHAVQRGRASLPDQDDL